MNTYGTRYFTLSALALVIILVVGCASAPTAEKLPPVFYPEPPELARVQFLTSFTSSKDIEADKSAFSQFVTGAKETYKRLDKPYGVAIHNGKIYVCDTNATVAVFDLDNRTLSPLKGSQGRGKLLQPINISIDKQGNKYVTDPIRQQVVVYDKNDFYVKAFGPLGDWKPVDAVVYEDKLYVADGKHAEVKVFHLETGEHLQSLGQPQEKKDRLVIPTNIAFDSEGFLYVSDTGRFQVLKLDRDGNLRGTFGRLGSSVGYFARPRGIAIDRENRLYAVDAAFDNVQMFTKDEHLLFFFGKAGKKPGDLFLPAKVAIDYDHIRYFQQYADPGFEIEAIVLVTSQFGARLVNVYGIGKEKGKHYPTEEELKKVVSEKVKTLPKEQPEDEEKKE